MYTLFFIIFFTILKHINRAISGNANFLTVSYVISAYERGHQRPSLTVYTFHAPEASLSQPASPVSTLTGVGASSRSTSPSTSLVNNTTLHVSPQTAPSRPPIPQRCSSLERPTIPTKANTSKSQSKTEAGKTILSKVHIHLPSGNLCLMFSANFHFCLFNLINQVGFPL